MAVISQHKISDEVLEKLQADMAEIKVALLGNEYNPHGALYRLAQHDNHIMEIQNKINRIIWSASGAGTVAGLIISFLYKIFFN